MSTGAPPDQAFHLGTTMLSGSPRGTSGYLPGTLRDDLEKPHGAGKQEPGSTSGSPQRLTRGPSPFHSNRQLLYQESGRFDRCNGDGHWREGQMPGSRFQLTSKALTRPHAARYAVHSFQHAASCAVIAYPDQIRDLPPTSRLKGSTTTDLARQLLRRTCTHEQAQIVPRLRGDMVYGELRTEMLCASRRRNRTACSANHITMVGLPDVRRITDKHSRQKWHRPFINKAEQRTRRGLSSIPRPLKEQCREHTFTQRHRGRPTDPNGRRISESCSKSSRIELALQKLLLPSGNSSRT